MSVTKNTKKRSIKININEKYDNVLDFYTQYGSLTQLFNVLIDECQRNKSFKFIIKKRIENINKTQDGLRVSKLH